MNRKKLLGSFRSFMNVERAAGMSEKLLGNSDVIKLDR